MRARKLRNVCASHRKTQIPSADTAEYLRLRSLLPGHAHKHIDIRIRDDRKLARRSVDRIAAKAKPVQFDDLLPKRGLIKLAIDGSRRE
jgi:hypothetical protein